MDQVLRHPICPIFSLDSHGFVGFKLFVTALAIFCLESQISRVFPRDRGFLATRINIRLSTVEVTSIREKH